MELVFMEKQEVQRKKFQLRLLRVKPSLTALSGKTYAELSRDEAHMCTHIALRCLRHSQLPQVNIWEGHTCLSAQQEGHPAEKLPEHLPSFTDSDKVTTS
jgi:hypothetical protein